MSTKVSYWYISVGIFIFSTGCTVKGSQHKNPSTDNVIQLSTSYTETIPGSEITFEMVAIPGGKFKMGSPNDEQGHKEDESPVHQVEIAPFWIGKHEITWDEFDLFVYPDLSKETTKKLAAAEIDGITQPTPPFVDMSFGMGKNGYPAINITQHSALRYCKWLTALTGDFYRLPTEAEWEYACRAGTTTAFSFGDDPKLLGEYAWHYENSDGGYGKIGTKKANPWGLHDMHGNVAEWTLDEYIPRYEAKEGKISQNPWVKTTKLYPQTVRGGSWDDDPEDLRSAARRPSKPNWKQRDPQIPKSNWWMTNAPFLGFRIVRPVQKPSQKEIDTYFSDPIPDL